MALRTKLSAKVLLLLLYQIILLGAATSQQCTGENSIKGKMLKGFTFQKMKVSNPSECYEACNNQIRCQSFNYVISQDMCELNNCTKEITPKDLERDPQRYFFQVKRQLKGQNDEGISFKVCSLGLRKRDKNSQIFADISITNNSQIYMQLLWFLPMHLIIFLQIAEPFRQFRSAFPYSHTTWLLYPRHVLLNQNKHNF